MADSDNATPRRDDTDDPRRSRERAVKILFQADVRHADVAVTLDALLDDPRARALIDEADDLTDGNPLLPPIAHEPGVEVEWVRDDPATSRSSDAGRGGGSTRGGRSGAREGRAPRVQSGAAGEEGLDGFTRSLVLGVYEHRARIDELIARFARRWQISRMPVVDRTVLRMATYELLHEPTSPAVVIDEAVGLAKHLSTDDSGRYVNGVLESIRKHLRDTATTPGEAPLGESAPDDEAGDRPDGDGPAGDAAAEDAPAGDAAVEDGADVPDGDAAAVDAPVGDAAVEDGADVPAGDAAVEDAPAGDASGGETRDVATSDGDVPHEAGPVRADEEE